MDPADWDRPVLDFAGIRFPTKAAAEKHIRWILSRYAQMRMLLGKDEEFVMALLARHPNQPVIEGCGIKRICVQWLDSEGKQRRFVAVRKDGSLRDFTGRHALYPRSATDNVRRVCRSLIQDQILAFKRRTFSVDIVLKCPVSGMDIRIDACDVDHIHPDTFIRLVDGWLISIGLTADDVDVIPSAEFGVADRFQDELLNENWREYHRINAKLRAVHAYANRSLLRRADGKPNA